jgi:predicted N-acetyltransferase YhbS
MKVPSNPKFRSYLDGDERQIVELLNKSFSNWGTISDWQKKYKQNPNFDPKLVFIGEDRGRIVGCVHYLRRDVKFKNGFLHAYVGGDGATLPGYSGKGVFSRGLRLLYKEVKRRNGSMVYGFNADGIHADFYRRKFGELGPYRPRVFIKILDFESLVSSILPAANRLIGKRTLIPSGKGTIVTLRLALGEANVDVCVTEKGLKLCRIISEPDVTIKTSLKTLTDGLADRRRLVNAIVLREIRLKTSGASVLKLFMLLVEVAKKRR